MKIFKSNKALIRWRSSQNSSSIGFVPTMGALHQGHISLIEKSTHKCDITIVSIFINPLQIAPNEDFNTYPKNIQQDITLLKDYNIDAIFIPQHTQMYEQDFSCVISETNLSKKLEGKSRPDFFDGVTTIVCKLFNLTQPQYVFFGLKDIQQLYIIKKMIYDLNYSIKIIACPTIRESNGLAMSSRNQYLTELEKKDAAIIYQTLRMGKKLIADSKKSIVNIKKEIKNKLLKNNFIVEYVSIANLNGFEEIEKYQKRQTVISVAVLYKNVRLIDNIIV